MEKSLSIIPPGDIPAAPSWLIPGTILENARFLAQHGPFVKEIALCLFESHSINFQELQDIAREILSLNFSFHAHLPTDLNWDDETAVQALVLGIIRHLSGAALSGVRAVLHPPGLHQADALGKLERMARAWLDAGFDPGHLLLENYEGVRLEHFEPLMREFGLSVCFDTGHCLAFQQEYLLERPGIMSRVGLLHLHAPGTVPENATAGVPGSAKKRDRHRPLGELEAHEMEFTRRVLAAAPSDAALLVEVFNWQGYCDSLPVLASLRHPIESV